VRLLPGFEYYAVAFLDESPRGFLTQSSQQLPGNTLAWFWARQRPRTIRSGQSRCRHPGFRQGQIQPCGYRPSYAILYHGRTRE